MTDATLCLRQGHQCECPTCQVWIERWETKSNVFASVDVMIHTERKNLFQICERLRGEHPEMLRLHHSAFEDEHVDFKLECRQKESENELEQPNQTVLEAHLAFHKEQVCTCG